MIMPGLRRIWRRRKPRRHLPPCQPVELVPIHIDPLCVKRLAVYRPAEHSPRYSTDHRRLTRSLHLKTRSAGICNLRHSDKDGPVNQISAYQHGAEGTEGDVVYLRRKPMNRFDSPRLSPGQKTMSADRPCAPIRASCLPFLSCVVRHLYALRFLGKWMSVFQKRSEGVRE